MALRCEICGKQPMYGHSVSHAKNRISRLFMPNLRFARIRIGSTVTHLRVCTKCLKRAKKDKTYILPVKSIKEKPPVIVPPVKVEEPVVKKKVAVKKKIIVPEEKAA